MNFTEGLKATGNIVQETPQAFFDWLNGIFRFDLDVCALPENAKCDKYYTPESDGLRQPWTGGVWCNPPYGREISKWVEKAVRERERERVQPIYRYVAPGTDRHQVVPKVCVRQGISVVRGWPSVVRGSERQCSVSECIGRVCKAKG